MGPLIRFPGPLPAAVAVPITFRCPDGHKLSVPDVLAGRKARCPLCRRKMYIPGDNSHPDQMARPAPEEPAATAESPAEESASKTLIIPTAIDKPRGEAADPPAIEPPAPQALDVALEVLDAPPAPARSGPDTYQPDPGKVQTVRLLTIALALAALFTAAPVVWHRNLLAAPDWARLVLLISIVQLAYVAWMATLPDWVSVWVAMLVHALVATLYGAALAIFLYTPVDAPLGLGLGDVPRRTAAGWCLCVVLISTLMTFACGRVCAAWRRADEWKRRREQSVARGQ